jgi:putative tributyrin esterase
MASLQATFYSKALRRLAAFHAFLPVDPMDDRTPTAKRPLRTLYLLHGLHGISSDWAYGSRAQELSFRFGMAIVMPTGENSFYLDDEEKAELFGEFTGKEIVEFTRSMLPLSDRREDCFLGGYSMGGFGAIRNGLKYSGTFGGVVALSSALITRTVAAMKPGYKSDIADYPYYRRVFGEPEALLGSDRDPEALVDGLLASSRPFPKLYLACGTEDFLIQENRAFHGFLEGRGVRHRYVESPGAHDFKYWDEHLEKALAWIDQGCGD